MFWFDRVRLAVNPGNIGLFLRAHRVFRSDPQYSVFNFARALWKVSRHERIVRHEGRFVHSSFLPPIPSRAANQVLDAVAGEGSVFQDHAGARRRAPISMYVAVTDRCGYSCNHCSAGERDQSTDWTLHQLKELFADLQDMGTAIIGLTGGEPLLRDDLPELIEGVDDRSVVYLFTSGQSLTRSRAHELKNAGLFAVGVSLDGCTAAEMDSRRGVQGAFDQAVDAVRVCREAGLYTMTQTVAVPGKLERGELQDVIELSASLGAHEVRVLESLPAGRLSDAGPAYLLAEKERQALKDFHVRMNRTPGLPKVSVFAHTEDHENYGCGAGTQHAYIDGSGHLYPCDFVPLAFGNVREVPIATLWKRLHEIVGKPRRQCMIMELHERGLLAGRRDFPLSPADSEACAAALGQCEELPGFYRALSGTARVR